MTKGIHMVLKNDDKNGMKPPSSSNGNQNDGYLNLNIVFISFIKGSTSKFTLKVLPSNLEIVRSLKDINWLRDNLSVEFPFYYVDS
jgi:hypothetical protein